MSTSKLARLVAELVGTFAVTLVVLSVGKTYGTPLFTTIAAASAFAGLMLFLGPVSGGHFNPALSLGLFSVRKISLLKTVLYVVMQFAGAILAWKLFEWLSPDRPVKLGATEFDWAVFVAELVGSVIFALGVAAVAFRKFTGGLAGASVGLAYFVGSIGLSVVIVNRQIVSGVLNPAVALGIGYRPENMSFMAYFFGPIIGAVLGFWLYKLLFVSREDTVAATSLVPLTVKKQVVAPVKSTTAKPKAAAKKSVKKSTKPKTTKSTRKSTRKTTK